ncbi:ribosomal-protein-alanine N-acetyltransferase [Parashewanella spongiae]|uniref:[Ribosomal protein bS18]-alanine N-acetyltransferase n=1 Tax=Parashewanella spongiae TaxID=342950 RepID=A0A3A6TCC1_9GAMM|nr:ribosomal protein S18-alanine N-acetyltransferase [Parashewanella spongiae]MCL1079508.1 ribosomal protein S18-alanine N-acetyltransferase [Parashewanella spongiae]RJY07506.1 ribosomal-protein-alanine N-acetyltransferase [Parashewanella spongiae]
MNTTAQNQFKFVTTKKQHLEQILEIENSAHSYPWSESNLSSCFSRLYHNTGVELNGKLVAFSIIHQVVDESTLMDICVHPNYQGFGFGKQLLIHAIDQAKNRNSAVMMLEVRASNHKALSLYEHLGFTETHRRKEYYQADSKREDAIMMELRFD